jgi:hypothetical protein
MLQIKLAIFVEVLTVVVCGVTRIFMPFPFIKLTLIVMAIVAGCILFVFAVTPTLERWLEL